MIFVFQSCNLDINVDPNNPSIATPKQLLPTAQVRIANSLGSGSIGISNGASVWMHQNVQRTSFDQYGVTGTAYSITNAWDESYTALKDLETIIAAATSTSGTKYAGIAKILKAYLFSEMVDTWGDIPFTEANKGSSVPYPKFDDDATIYPALLKLLDEGIADIAKADASVFNNASDLIYSGDVSKWRKFAKTLKLKLLTNTRLVNNVTADAQALVTEADLIGSNDDFELVYGTSVSPENRNPGYLIDYPNGRTNYVSPYFFEIMTGQNTFKHGNDLMSGILDPRVPYYFFNQKKKGEAAENPSEYANEVGTGGKFISIFFGSKGKNQGFDQAGSQTMPGLYFAGGKYDNGTGGKVGTSSGKGVVSLRMLPYYNRMFLQAELASVGTISGDAKAFLTAGNECSLCQS
ncbi:MAG: SusD/RagB family nutrient-binding outer membrane lipoprotein [Saprospiraceae bacterium]|nr:SusD/RagB family nutrient-binding outer membrane lipoprotein [Saprospiraceae bacterium]